MFSVFLSDKRTGASQVGKGAGSELGCICNLDKVSRKGLTEEGILSEDLREMME